MIAQGKIALLAAVMLGVVRAHWIAGQARMLAAVPDHHPIYFLQFLANVLFLLPLPVLLFLLFQSRTTIVLSTSLRRAALAAAVVLGVITVPTLCGLSLRLIQDIGFSPGSTGAGKIATWLQSENARSEIWSALIQLSQIALVAVLFSLARRSANPPVHTVHAAALRLTATIATIAAIVAIFTGLIGQVGAAFEFTKRQAEFSWWGGPTLFQFIFLNALSETPKWCMGIIAFILYRSQTAQSPSGPVEIART